MSLNVSAKCVCACVCVFVLHVSVLLDTWYYRPLPGEIPLRLLWKLFLEKRDILAFPLTLTVFTPLFGVISNNSFQVWPVAALAKEQRGRLPGVHSSLQLQWGPSDPCTLAWQYFRGCQSDHVWVSCGTGGKVPSCHPVGVRWGIKLAAEAEIKLDNKWFPKSMMPVTVVNWLWWRWCSSRQVNV